MGGTGLSKYSKVRIIVAFGDIEGFTHFWEEVTNDQAELIPYLEGFDAIIDDIERESGQAFADTGDGFMLIVEMDGRSEASPVSLLATLWRLLRRIQRMHGHHAHPKPNGFRIVLASGYVLKRVRKDGRVSHRGRHINLAHNLLDLARGRGLVCHSSFKALISDKDARTAGVRFTPLRLPRNIPWSVPRKDAASLFQVEFRK